MTESTLLALEPVLGYPRTARASGRYVLTVDLRSPSGEGGWPYPDAEETVFYCLLNPSALFQSEPLGEPAVVLHRFGGTYGPARFLLTASAEPQAGTLQVTLVNGRGVPLLVLETDEIEITRPAEAMVEPRSGPAARPEPHGATTPGPATPPTALPGQPYPLGATWDGEGVNFAFYSELAWKVELAIYDHPDAPQPSRTFRLRERNGFVWHGYVPDLAPGTLYGYRIDGPYDVARGHRCNPFKLLIDPHAKALAGTVNWVGHPYAYPFDQPEKDFVLDDQQDDQAVPKGVVIDDRFDWRGDRPPRIPWTDTVIYEAHVKGLTMLHPDVPEEIRGTYTGVSHPAVTEHLKSLGVTAVELLPVHEFVDDRHLVERGLHNYWGYTPLNFFAPAARYARSKDPQEQVREFKEMVRRLHEAGIEVILDVVYHATAEGNHLGPTLSFKGIDNPTYYRLVPGDPRFYLDFTGAGNSLNLEHPQTQQLVVTSLRYWVQEMHVDGFRFDRAPALARQGGEVSRNATFFSLIHSDPVLSQVKLIAEPWDVGPGGYQLGNFPVQWAEWNGKYQDTVRSFWRGDPGMLGDLGYRLTGSSDLFEATGRRPLSSINYVTSHEGFTLTDLVSYNQKHNEANGEMNRDGLEANLSYNFGVEGPTDQPEIMEARERQKRNFIATLYLSQGVPMLRAGDELGHTQRGNNNAFCQDNEISWINWRLSEADQRLLEFTRAVARLRREHPVFRRTQFLRGRVIRGSELKDITWLSPTGKEMEEADWSHGFIRCFGMLYGGDALDEWDVRGGRIVDDTFLILFNADSEPIHFALPEHLSLRTWHAEIATGHHPVALSLTSDIRHTVLLEPHSMVVLHLLARERDHAADVSPTVGGISIHIGVDSPTSWKGHSLSTSERSARKMAELASQAGYTDIRLLCGADATREAVDSQLMKAARALLPGQTLFVSFSGLSRAVRHKDSDQTFDLDESFCLYDDDMTDDALIEYLRLLAPGTRALLVFDCSFGGGFLSTSNPAGTRESDDSPPTAQVFRPLNPAPMHGPFMIRPPLDDNGIRASVLLLAAADKRGLAREGLYTYELLSVWSDGQYTGSFLELHREVARRCSAEFGGQTPQIRIAGAPDPSFPMEPAFHLERPMNRWWRERL